MVIKKFLLNVDEDGVQENRILNLLYQMSRLPDGGNEHRKQQLIGQFRQEALTSPPVGSNQEPSRSGLSLLSCGCMTTTAVADSWEGNVTQVVKVLKPLTPTESGQVHSKLSPPVENVAVGLAPCTSGVSAEETSHGTGNSSKNSTAQGSVSVNSADVIEANRNNNKSDGGADDDVDTSNNNNNNNEGVAA